MNSEATPFTLRRLRPPYRRSSRATVSGAKPDSVKAMAPSAPTTARRPPPRPGESRSERRFSPSLSAASRTYRFCVIAIEAPSSCANGSPSSVVVSSTPPGALVRVEYLDRRIDAQLTEEFLSEGAADAGADDAP